MKSAALLTAAAVVSSLLIAELCRPRAPELAAMFLHDGKTAEAAELIGQLESAGDTSAPAIAARVEFLVASGDVERAIGLLEAFLRAHPGDHAGRELLARLYGDAQRPRERVRELWTLLRERPDAGRLRDLAVDFAAQGDWKHSRDVLALLAREGGAQAGDLVELAQLDAATGRLRDALRVLEMLRAQHPETYDDNLARFHDELEAQVQSAKLGDAGERRGIRPSLGRVWQAVAADGRSCAAGAHSRRTESLLQRLALAPDDDARTAIIERLERTGARERVLTAVEYLAERDPDTWLGAYVERARSAHAEARMRLFMASRVTDSAAPRARRESFAYVLLEQGASEEALRAVESLAAEFGGDWIDAYVDLLTKAHREAEVLPWLQGRAGAAPPADKAAWMRRLTDSGAPDRALSVFEASSERSPAMRLARLEALAAQGDQGSLRKALRAELEVPGIAQPAASTPGASVPEASPPSAPTLRALGDIARNADLQAEAERAYAAWAAMEPQDAAARRAYALAALAAGHSSVADAQLSRLRSLEAPDFETSIAAGDAAVALGDEGRARLWYGRALQLPQSPGSPDYAQQAARARALQHLGRIAEASKAYGEMAAARPADLSLRADWAEMLLNAGQLRQAHGVALQEPTAPGAMTPERRRLELLNAQSELRMGDPRSALARVQPLHEAAPQDLETLTQLAAIERQLEWWRPAREHYQQAMRTHATDDTREQLLDINREQGVRGLADISHISSQHGPTLVLGRMAGGQRLPAGWLVTGTLERARVDSKGVQHPGGEVLSFAGDRTRGEIALQHDGWQGTTWRGSVYSGYGDVAGFGVLHARALACGSLLFTGEYRRPNWDFTEGLVSGATRDRLGIGRNTVWGAGSLKVELDASTYRLAHVTSARSFTLTAAFRHPLSGSDGRLWVAYTLDGEYYRDVRHSIDSSGQVYEPLPVADRELHYLQLEASRQLFGHGNAARGVGEFSAGAVANRFGRVEPTVTGALSWSRAELQLRAYVTHEPSTAAQYDVVTAVGGTVSMVFP